MKAAENGLARLPAFIRPDVDAAMRVFAAWPSIRCVWLFGSLAKGRQPDFRSDIDFAVEGLPALAHYRALSQLDAVVSLPADLVRWEDADDVLRAQIREWGILLYERT
ncbi:MAG: nucleotidyltransferase domain-containing protein [Verrucomicrobia bacterium]|nr:nucleotidyltransferase domain-containing protein [Verrucomicrobiota bacterium]